MSVERFLEKTQSGLDAAHPDTKRFDVFRDLGTALAVIRVLRECLQGYEARGHVTARAVLAKADALARCEEDSRGR